MESSEWKLPVLARNHCTKFPSASSTGWCMHINYKPIRKICNWPEENNETICFQNHANNWPSYDHKEEASTKWNGSPHNQQSKHGVKVSMKYMQMMQGSHMHTETGRLTTLKFRRFMKNCMVDFGPIVRLTPEMKRIWSSTTKKEALLKWYHNTSKRG